VEPELWELDHIIPLVRGGKHILENVAVSHRFCNRSKGAKLFSEMLIIPARYRKEI
jgi:5-methylcytosine-specific restriction endonuclease McrA